MLLLCVCSQPFGSRREVNPFDTSVSLCLSLSLFLSFSCEQTTDESVKRQMYRDSFDYEELKRVLKDRVPDLLAVRLVRTAFQALGVCAQCLFYSLPKENQILARGLRS